MFASQQQTRASHTRAPILRQTATIKVSNSSCVPNEGTKLSEAKNTIQTKLLLTNLVFQPELMPNCMVQFIEQNSCNGSRKRPLKS